MVTDYWAAVAVERVVYISEVQWFDPQLLLWQDTELQITSDGCTTGCVCMIS